MIVSRRIFLATFGVAVLAIAILLSGAWSGVAKGDMSLFDSRASAAHQGSRDRVGAVPIASFRKGERFLVLWDEYGKD